MQLTRFTDLGLRVLIYLSNSKPNSVITIAEITDRFEIAHNHLTKVVQFMGKQGWLHNIRGKGGGIMLAKAPLHYRLGDLVRALEYVDDLIDCEKPPCVLRGRCVLKNILCQAQEAFYKTLDQFTLADTMVSPTLEIVMQLHAGTLKA